jgi:hypothetical protein
MCRNVDAAVAVQHHHCQHQPQVSCTAVAGCCGFVCGWGQASGLAVGCLLHYLCTKRARRRGIGAMGRLQCVCPALSCQSCERG